MQQVFPEFNNFSRLKFESFKMLKLNFAASSPIANLNFGSENTSSIFSSFSISLGSHELL